jgi:hypothetical protein
MMEKQLNIVNMSGLKDKRRVKNSILHRKKRLPPQLLLLEALAVGWTGKCKEDERCCEKIER